MGGTTHGVGWGERKYHPGQSAGDNTDYGLGTLFLLEYLSGKGEGDDLLHEVFAPSCTAQYHPATLSSFAPDNCLYATLAPFSYVATSI